MLSKVRLSTYISNSLILYGTALKKDYKTVEELKDSLPSPLYLYEEIETARKEGLARISKVEKTGEVIVLAIEVDEKYVLDTLNMSGIKRLAEGYTEINKIDSTILKSNPPSKADTLVLKYLLNKKAVKGIRTLITSGEPIYKCSELKRISYIRYDIYDKSIILNVSDKI